MKKLDLKFPEHETEKHMFRNRITELRLAKNVSESQMSLDLGCSRGYIRQVTNGKIFLSFERFIDICNYFSISPSEFFDFENKAPATTNELIQIYKNLNDADSKRVYDLADRLQK